MRIEGISIDAEEARMSGQGSTGNVIAAICSFFIPGLGQLVQGRLFAAIVYFIFAFALWIILLGWIVHLISILDAAMYVPPHLRRRNVQVRYVPN